MMHPTPTLFVHATAVCLTQPKTTLSQRTTSKRPRTGSCRRPICAKYHDNTHNNGDASSQNDARDGTASTKANNWIRDVLLSGFEPSPEILAILSAYFVQGALGISRLGISFFLKDDLALSPAATSALTGIATLPWLIKPAYGFLTDALPINGLRRRPYLLGAAALGVLSWGVLATVVHDVPSAISAITLSSLSVAVTDVVVDSLVVERVRGLPTERAGALQSLCWGTSAIGGLLSAYFSGSLLDALGTRAIFGVTAALPLLTGLLALAIAEQPVSYRISSPSELAQTLSQRAQSLWAALRMRSVFLPALFIFLWQGTPSPDSALFYFQTNVLQFGPEFLGRVRLLSSAAALIGVAVYNTTLRKVDLKKIFKYATLISVPLSLSQVILVTRANVALGISDQAFALADSAVLTVIGQVAFMPTLVLASRLCPPGVEGTLFAALMSVFNASGATSSELGALLTAALGVTESNFDNLALLVTLCSFAFLLPLPLLNLLDNAPPEVVEGDLNSKDKRSSNGHDVSDVTEITHASATITSSSSSRPETDD